MIFLEVAHVLKPISSIRRHLGCCVFNDNTTCGITILVIKMVILTKNLQLKYPLNDMQKLQPTKIMSLPLY